MLMPLAAFKKMNDEREEKGLSVFANPRNATAGTVRQLEPQHHRTAQARLFRLHALAAKMAAPSLTGTGKRSTHWTRLASRSIQAASWPKASIRFGPSSSRKSPSAKPCPTKSTASSSRWIAPPCSRNWATPAKLRAGPSPTNTRRAGNHQGRRHSGASRAHRETHAGRGIEAGSHRRNHGQPRHPAQHGRDRAPGREDRRLGGSRARRRRHPQGHAGDRRQRPSPRPQTVSTCRRDVRCAEATWSAPRAKSTTAA